MTSSLLASAFSKQIQMIVKNFKSDMVKNWTFSDCLLDEVAMKDLLELPDAVEVESIHVDHAKVSIPWRNIKHEPVHLAVENVVAVLYEPEELKPKQRVFPPSDPKKKRNLIDKITDGLMLSIKHVHLTYKPRGRPRPGRGASGAPATPPPPLVIEISDMVMRATNNKWKVVDLQQARRINKGKTEVMVFRTVDVAQLRIGVQVAPDRVLNVINHSDSPIILRMLMKYAAIGGASIKFEIDAFVDSIVTHLDQETWNAFTESLDAVQVALDRELEPEIVRKRAAEKAALGAASPSPSGAGAGAGAAGAGDGSDGTRSSGTNGNKAGRRRSSRKTGGKGRGAWLRGIVRRRGTTGEEAALPPGTPDADGGDGAGADGQGAGDPANPAAGASSPPSDPATATTSPDDATDDATDLSTEVMEDDDIFQDSSNQFLADDEDISRNSINILIGYGSITLGAAPGQDHFARMQFWRLEVTSVPHDERLRLAGEISESINRVAVLQAQVTEITPRSDKHPSYTTVFSSALRAAVKGGKKRRGKGTVPELARPSTVELVESSQDGLYSAFVKRWTTPSDELLRLFYISRKLPWRMQRPEGFTGREIEIHSHGVRAIFDRDLFERLHVFMMGGRGAELQRKVETAVEGLVEAAMYEPMQVKVELSAPVILLPPFAGHRGPEHIASQIMTLRCESLTVSTDRLRPRPPLFADVAPVFPHKQGDWLCSTFDAPSELHAYLLAVNQLQLEIQSSPSATPAHVVLPLSLQVSMAFREWAAAGSRTGPQIEVCLSIDEVTGRVTKEQMIYLNHIDERLDFAPDFSASSPSSPAVLPRQGTAKLAVSGAGSAAHSRTASTTSLTSMTSIERGEAPVTYLTMLSIGHADFQLLLPQPSASEAHPVLARFDVDSLVIAAENLSDRQAVKVAVRDARLFMPQHNQVRFPALIRSTARQHDTEMVQVRMEKLYVMPPPEGTKPPCKKFVEVLVTGLNTCVILNALMELNLFIREDVSFAAKLHTRARVARAYEGYFRSNMKMNVTLRDSQLFIVDSAHVTQCMPATVDVITVERELTAPKQEEMLVTGERMRIFTAAFDGATEVQRDALCEPFDFSTKYLRYRRADLEYWVNDISIAISRLAMTISRPQMILMLNVADEQVAHSETIEKLQERTAIFDDTSDGGVEVAPRNIITVAPPALLPLQSPSVAPYQVDRDEQPRSIANLLIRSCSIRLRAKTEASDELADFAEIEMDTVKISSERRAAVMTTGVRIRRVCVFDLATPDRVPEYPTVFRPRDPSNPMVAAMFPMMSKEDTLASLRWDDPAAPRGSPHEQLSIRMDEFRKHPVDVPVRVMSRLVIEVRPSAAVYVPELINNFSAFFTLLQEQRSLRKRLQRVKITVRNTLAEGDRLVRQGVAERARPSSAAPRASSSHPLNAMPNLESMHSLSVLPVRLRKQSDVSEASASSGGTVNSGGLGEDRRGSVATQASASGAGGGDSDASRHLFTVIAHDVTVIVPDLEPLRKRVDRVQAQATARSSGDNVSSDGKSNAAGSVPPSPRSARASSMPPPPPAAGTSAAAAAAAEDASELGGDGILSMLELRAQRLYVSNDGDYVLDRDISRTELGVSKARVHLQSLEQETNQLQQAVSLISPASVNVTILAKAIGGSGVPQMNVSVDIDAVRANVSARTYRTMLTIAERYSQRVVEAERRRKAVEAERQARAKLAEHVRATDDAAELEPLPEPAPEVDRIVEITASHIDIAIVSDYVAKLDLFFVHFKNLHAQVLAYPLMTEATLNVRLEVLVNNLNFMIPEAFIDPVHLELSMRKGNPMRHELGDLSPALSPDIFDVEAVALSPIRISITKEHLRHLHELAQLMAMTSADDAAATANGANGSTTQQDGTSPDQAVVSVSPRPGLGLAGQQQRRRRQHLHFNYVLINNTEVAVEYKQSQTAKSTVLLSGSQTSFSFSNPYLPMLLDVTLAGGWSTTRGLSLDVSGATPIRVFREQSRNHRRRGPRTVMAKNQISRTLIVNVRPEGLRKIVELLASYQFVNDTNDYIEIRIAGKQVNSVSRCAAGQTIPICYNPQWTDTRFAIRPGPHWDWSTSFDLSARTSVVKLAMHSARLNRESFVFLHTTPDPTTGVVQARFAAPLIVRNSSDFPLQFCFPSVDLVGNMPPRSEHSFFFDPDNPLGIAFRMNESQTWSKTIATRSLGRSDVHFVTSAPSSSGDDVKTLQDDVVYCLVTEARLPGRAARTLDLSPQVLIVNDSDLLVHVRHQRVMSEVLEVRPHSRVPFAWRRVPGPRRLQLMLGGAAWSSNINTNNRSHRVLQFPIPQFEDEYNNSSSKKKGSGKKGSAGGDDEDAPPMYKINVDVTLVENNPSSRVVTLSPRLHFVNQSTYDLLLSGDRDPVLLPSLETLPSIVVAPSCRVSVPRDPVAGTLWSWESVPLTAAREFSMRLLARPSMLDGRGGGGGGSGSDGDVLPQPARMPVTPVRPQVTLASADGTPLPVVDAADSPEHVGLDVQVRHDELGTSVVFADNTFAPFVLQNQSDLPMQLVQVSAPDQLIDLPPRSLQSFYWPRPCDEPVVLVRVLATDEEWAGLREAAHTNRSRSGSTTPFSRSARSISTPRSVRSADAAASDNGSADGGGADEPERSLAPSSARRRGVFARPGADVRSFRPWSRPVKLDELTELRIEFVPKKSDGTSRKTSMFGFVPGLDAVVDVSTGMIRSNRASVRTRRGSSARRRSVYEEDTAPEDRDPRFLAASIRARGKTRLLVLSEPRPAEIGVAGSALGLSRPPAKVDLRFNLRLPRINMQLLDEAQAEVMFLTAHEINLEHARTEQREYLYMTLSSAQVDNMLPNAEYNVLVAEDRRSISGYKANLFEMLQETAVHDGFRFSQYVGVRLLPLIVAVDGLMMQHIANLALIFKGDEAQATVLGASPEDRALALARVSNKTPKLRPNAMTVAAPGRVVSARQRDDAASKPKMCVEELVVFPLSLHLSIGDNLLRLPVIREGMPLHLPQYRRRHLFDSPDALAGEVARAYLRLGLSEIYNIALSLDFLGSPLGALRKVSTGLRDLVVIPWERLVLDDTPGSFFSGLRIGMASFIHNQSDALFMTLLKLLGTGSWVLVQLSFDYDYVNLKMLDRRCHPLTLLQGVIEGSRQLGRSVVSALTGVVMHPYTGMQEGGWVGCATGVGKGIIGVPLKIFGGALDLIVKTMEGGMSQVGIGFVVRSRLHSPNSKDDLTAAHMVKVQNWLLRNSLRYGTHAHVKVITQRKRLRDRILVLTTSNCVMFNPSRMGGSGLGGAIESVGENSGMDRDYEPTNIPFAVIREVVLPFSPETNLTLRLSTRVNRKDSYDFLMANRTRFTTKMKQSYFESEGVPLKIVELGRDDISVR